MAAATMTPTSPSAFLLSAMLHGVVIALALMGSCAATRRDRNEPKILELVAGEGDNYGAREAPALGSEGGVKLKVPEASAPKPMPLPPIEPNPVAPAPVKPAPVPATPAPKTNSATGDATPNFKKKLLYEVVRGDAKAKREIRKEREAEAKRLAEEKKRMTLEEFNRTQKNKSSSTKVASAKITPIDGEGIAKGVVGGSTSNKIGGAGGKALRSDSDDVLGSYYSMFKMRLREKFEPPPGLSDSLKATVEVRSNLDGSLVNPRLTQTSGSREFDAAVIEAIRRVRMPPRPADRKAETIEFVFNMRERDEG